MKTLVVILFLICSNSFGQVNQAWQQFYNGSDSLIDRGSSMVRDNSGNLYITGSSSGMILGTDILTVKYNSSGVFQWARTFNGTDSSTDAGIDIAVDNIGNVYVVGTARNNSVDAVLIKYSPDGVQQWVKAHNGTGNGTDNFNDVFVDINGNIYATGNIRNTNTDLLAVKYNAAGSLLWEVSYNVGSSNEIGEALTVGDSGNVYVAGSTASTGASYVDMYIVKINALGIPQWHKSYAGVGIGVDEAFSVATGDSGNVYITGNSFGGTGTNYDVTTIKYGLDGSQKWVAKYSPAGYQLGNKVLTDDSGNVYVQARTGDYTLIKYGSDGQQKWISHYNGPHNYIDEPADMCRDIHGNIYMTGYAEDTAATADGFFYPRATTVKFSPAGDIVWSKRRDDYGLPTSIACDNNGNIFITGDGTQPGANGSVLTVAYSSSVGISQISTEVPSMYILSQNYPNPFNPSTRIKFQIPSSSFVKLAVYDIAGREVALLVNNELSAGIYEYSFNAKKLTSGVYFYKLEAKGIIETKKMLLVK